MLASEKENITFCKGNSGLALITVIAVIAILSILVLEFASRTLIDVDISANFRDRVQAQYNAEAGLNYAIKMLRDDDASLDSLQDAWASPQTIFIGDLVRHYRTAKDDEGKSDLEIEQEKQEMPEPVDHGFGKAHIYIVDEERKLNINRLISARGTPDDNFRAIVSRLITSLEYPDVNVEDLLDNITDWIDSDDDGMAEKSSYYDYLDPPYEPANTFITSIYQLLLVKGMSRLILFGDTPYPPQKTGLEDEKEGDNINYEALAATEYDVKKPVYGLSNFITASTRGAININTATREVLMALLDEQQYLVEDIITKRMESPLQNMQEQIQPIFNNVSPDYFRSKRNYIAIRSNYFYVTSIGEFGSSRVKLVALVYRASRNEIRVQYQRYENMSRFDKLPFPVQEWKNEEGS